MAPRDHNGDAATLATELGWFSLGLGTAQLLAPGRVNRAIGVRDDRRSRFWQRVVGVQELTAAAGILGRRRPVEWLWARTAGDVVHLAMLARARRGERCERPERLEAAIASVVSCFAADAYASTRMTSDPQVTREGHPMKAKASITVGQPRDEVQRRWREFEQQGGDASRLGPIEVLDEHAGSIRWRTADRAAAKASGMALFVDAPGDRGTEIHLELEYEVTGGAVGAAVKKVIGDEPLQMAKDDLRRFKQLVETGEIARSDGAPTGHSARLQPKQRPAQPLEHAHA
ncbi:MAG: hypothetical protein QOG35_1596 [Solirubrobacteraceae bacterium]|jgi:uncharacterized membrane protein|nr:hypothetical protein [Solirubrobacteraceae bacterium]